MWAARARVCASTRSAGGEARVEEQQRARVHVGAGIRLWLVSLRVLGVHPLGPSGGLNVAEQAARSGRCLRDGLARAARLWVERGASRLRCPTPPRAAAA